MSNFCVNTSHPKYWQRSSAICHNKSPKHLDFKLRLKALLSASGKELSRFSPTCSVYKKPVDQGLQVLPSERAKEFKLNLQCQRYPSLNEGEQRKVKRILWDMLY